MVAVWVAGDTLYTLICYLGVPIYFEDLVILYHISTNTAIFIHLDIKFQICIFRLVLNLRAIFSFAYLFTNTARF